MVHARLLAREPYPLSSGIRLSYFCMHVYRLFYHSTRVATSRNRCQKRRTAHSNQKLPLPFPRHLSPFDVNAPPSKILHAPASSCPNHAQPPAQPGVLVRSARWRETESQGDLAALLRSPMAAPDKGKMGEQQRRGGRPHPWRVRAFARDPWTCTSAFRFCGGIR